MRVDTQAKIPNNVNLDSNKTLQRALEHWLPKYQQWWAEMGPVDSAGFDVYLRTAVSVDSQGWAQFDYVKMPEYRWGIFLTEPEPNRMIPFGHHKGEPVWNDVPGEYRSTLRRIIVTQGDTEPASVEQQRGLGQCCPSLYDLRNLYQVNVEEGRHLWAMVYLLHAYFGRDGREEGDALLERRSGDPDKPRILGAFNEKTPDWLSFFMFTFLTDRDGKYQLAALAESGFDPLARSTKFMLTEEAHHLFVGETGIGRIIQRTLEVMKQHGTEDPAKLRALGVIDLPTLQRYLNFHFSVTLDLYGSELSTNASNFYSQGLKSRFEESRLHDDHLLAHAAYPVLQVEGDRLISRDEPALLALNERLRDDYIVDVQGGVDRWNRLISKAGYSTLLVLPHKGFHRAIGNARSVKVDPAGKVITEATWNHHHAEWLPSASDHAFVQSLMGRVVEPGKYAGYISPPARSINNQAADFAYVRFD